MADKTPATSASAVMWIQHSYR